MITAKTVRVPAMVTKMGILVVSCFFMLHLSNASVPAPPHSAHDIDKYVKGLTFGKRDVSGMEQVFSPQLLSALELDRFVKRLTFGKRSGEKGPEAEKKSFASYRWRPANG